MLKLSRSSRYSPEDEAVPPARPLRYDSLFLMPRLAGSVLRHSAEIPLLFLVTRMQSLRSNSSTVSALLVEKISMPPFLLILLSSNSLPSIFASPALRLLSRSSATMHQACSQNPLRRREKHHSPYGAGRQEAAELSLIIQDYFITAILILQKRCFFLFSQIIHANSF